MIDSGRAAPDGTPMGASGKDPALPSGSLPVEL